MSKAVYKFHFYCGRMGSLKGVFVEDERLVEQCIGKEIYFGEVLGKHSEVYGPLEISDLTKVTDDPEIIRLIKDNDLETGTNPIDVLLCEVEYNEKDNTYVLEDGTIIQDY